jgi:hypothetical protein
LLVISLLLLRISFYLNNQPQLEEKRTIPAEG